MTGLFCIFFSFFAPIAAGAPACKTDLFGRLRALNVPGLAVAIVKNGHLVCTATAGMANIEKKVPVTPETLFLVASVSKTVTATALMQLHEQNKFDLDDDVNEYLPFKVRIPGSDDAPITFRQLLTHTASIEDSSLRRFVEIGADSPIELGALVKGYLTPGGAYYDPDANFLAGPPGTVSDYSNMGIVFAGYLAEVISGTPLDKYIRDNILLPLGMSKSSFRLADIDPSMLAMPYGDMLAGGFQPFGQYGEANYPDGMLRTSAVELAKFLIANMEGGALDGRRILKIETVAEMLRNQTPLNPTQGLVWFSDTFFGRLVWGHNGSDYGASAEMWFDPATREGVVLMANGNWEDKDQLVKSLFEEADQY